MLYLDGYRVHSGVFPNKETYVEEGPKEGRNVHQVIMYFEDNNDLINLMFLKRHLDEDTHNRARLIVQYFPYERMDRRNSSYAASLKYVCEFINSLNFMEVVIMEPHSDVLPMLLNNCVVQNYVIEMLPNVMLEVHFLKEMDYILFPDAGAEKRYSGKLAGYRTLLGVKHRDFHTGRIERYDINANDTDNIKPKKVIIVDDLCSKGGTFLLAAKKLKQLFGEDVKVYLLVAHMEDAAREGELFKEDSPIDKVFCSNSIVKYWRSPNMEVITKGDFARV